MNMDQSSSVYFILVSIALCLPCCLACDGYQITNIKITRCDPKGEDIIKLSDLSIDLHDDCTVNVKGCVEIFKKINTMTVNYVGKKDFFSLRGTKDICQVLIDKAAEVKEGFDYAKVSPPNCPFNPMKVCGPEEPFNMTKLKNYLPMAKGKLSADIKLTTDAGPMCLKGSANVVKSKKG